MTVNNSETKILIVDDESEARRQLHKFLEIDFWEADFDEASNGHEALDSLERWRPKVIVSDINMPHMDGFKLLQRVKDESPKTQVIIITGREDHDAPIKALKYGASDYLVKPLNMEELSLAIKRALNNWEVDDQLEKYREHLENLVEKRTKGLLAMNKTLSKEKEANKELELQFLQAQKMEAIGALAGGIAHDFNNILSAILGFTDMTLDHLEEGSRGKNNLKEVLKAGARAKSLVRQILSFSRQDNRKRLNIEVADIVNEALDLLRASLPSTIAIEHDVDFASGVALVDQTQISQVVMNLCVNAQHAMMENGGGTLTVSLKAVDVDEEIAATNTNLQVGPYIRLVVSDTGHGMDRATMARIFDPFFTTKDVGEGTGLGLAAVHGIVAGHDGAILVESKPGKGSTFSLYLPRVEAIPENKNGRKGEIVKGTEKILLVDDEEQLVQMWKMMLEELGYEVTAFTGADAALKEFKENPDRFDLVITDQTMPELTGAELATEMMVIRPDIPIILCTGFSQQITPELAGAMGFRKYVLKPLVVWELAEAVRQALDKKSN